MFSNLITLRPVRGPLLGLITAFGLLGASATSASALSLVNTNPCNANPVSQPFLQWGDSGTYELAPDGNFASAPTGWTLSGGAGRVTGGSSFDTPALASSYSLALPAGASAQTPASCVDAAYPTFRFLTSSAAGGTMLVEVVYPTLLGEVAVPVQTLLVPSSWQPTPDALTVSLVTALLKGGTTQMSIRFVALTGSIKIDDVYIDPRMV